jgi:hypothetical protein
VSAFLSTVVNSLIKGIIVAPELNVVIDPMTLRDQITALYGELYKVDPVSRWGTDFVQFQNFLEISPTYSSMPYGLNAKQYRYMQEVMKIFAPFATLGEHYTISA